MDDINPPHLCKLCPRLADFINDQRVAHPDWFNGPVPSFGDMDGRLMIVGLAPGLRGANCTGRPFTGDYAGDLLYATLESYGYTSGYYDKRIDDGFALHDVLISNAVRCVPPQNKPTPKEITTCRPYLLNTISEMKNLQAFMVLGRIAHETLLRSFGLRLADYPFSHGAVHQLENGHTLHDSYHCSRYNTNTGRLTEPMFHKVFDGIRDQFAD